LTKGNRRAKLRADIRGGARLSIAEASRPRTPCGSAAFFRIGPMESLVTQLASQGPAWALLLLVGLAIRKVLLWASPRADRVVDAHCGLVDTLKTNDVRQTEALERQTHILEEQSSLLAEIHKRTSHHGD